MPVPIPGATWIPLTRGLWALVDDADAPLVNELRWYARRSRNTWYAMRRSRSNNVHMHRLLVDVPVGCEVDHINGNGLDNRRANLRAVPHAENLANTGRRSHNTSGYKGVKRALARHGYKRPWRAVIRVRGQEYWLGAFWTAEEAASVYDRAARKHFGAFARTNFAPEWSG